MEGGRGVEDADGGCLEGDGGLSGREEAEEGHAD